MSIEHDLPLQRLLHRLHTQSRAQEEAANAYLAGPGADSTTGSEQDLRNGRDFWRDKLVALDADKARFCYALCRALQAKRIIEAGTSFGVSTLYLAAAVRDNGGGTVIATEYEELKARMAREHFKEAGLSDYIELREGDIRQTLQILPERIDFLLLDIWTPMVRPTLELVAPKMRRGAIVVADNTANRAQEYADLFSYMEDASHGFITMTLPFDGGLEMSVKVA